MKIVVKGIELSVEEAKELYKELDQLFGKKEDTYTPMYPLPPVSDPYITYCGQVEFADLFADNSSSAYRCRQ